MILLWAIVMIAAAILGLYIGLREHTQSSPVGYQVIRTPGWVYFLSSVGGADDDPPAPIKIGMTHRDPAVYRLPEIETMSPKPLEIIATIPTDTPELLERRIHKELAQFRRHGEWFDRDAVLAWFDHYQEEA